MAIDGADKSAIYKQAVAEAEHALERESGANINPERLAAARDRLHEAQERLDRCSDGRAYGVKVTR